MDKRPAHEILDIDIMSIYKSTTPMVEICQYYKEFIKPSYKCEPCNCSGLVAYWTERLILLYNKERSKLK
jgi:hypothetical protein